MCLPIRLPCCMCTIGAISLIVPSRHVLLSTSPTESCTSIKFHCNSSLLVGVWSCLQHSRWPDAPTTAHACPPVSLSVRLCSPDSWFCRLRPRPSVRNSFEGQQWIKKCSIRRIMVRAKRVCPLSCLLQTLDVDETINTLNRHLVPSTNVVDEHFGPVGIVIGIGIGILLPYLAVRQLEDRVAIPARELTVDLGLDHPRRWSLNHEYRHVR